MASSKEYLDFVLEQLEGAEGLSARAMMGEYLLCCRGRVVGGVYDDRFLLKPTPGALRLLSSAGIEPEYELPYPGAKEQLLAPADDGALCRLLVQTIAEELSAPKKRRS